MPYAIILSGPGSREGILLVITIGLVSLVALLLFAVATSNWSLLRVISPKRGAAMRDMSEERAMRESDLAAEELPEDAVEGEPSPADAPIPLRRQETWASLGWDPSAPRS